MKENQNSSELLIKLKSLISDTPSTWRERAEFRIKNRKWLRRSQKVSFKILDAMRKQNLTKSDLSEKMDVFETEVDSWVKGSHNFSFKLISEIETALNINLQ